MNTRNIIEAVLTLILVAGISAPAIAQDKSNLVRNITVSGNGEASAVPDRATINAGVQVRAATAVEASRDNQEIIERVIKALTDAGVEAKDIQTADYSIWPEQQHDPRGTGEITVTGYRVNNTVRILVKDVDRIGNIIGAVTDAGANTIHGISFHVDDTSELETRAREAAMADARRRAESLARLAGVNLGEVLTISMSTGGGYPVPLMGMRADMAQAATVPGISVGQSSVTVQVQVSYAIESTSSNSQ